MKKENKIRDNTLMGQTISVLLVLSGIVLAGVLLGIVLYRARRKVEENINNQDEGIVKGIHEEDTQPSLVEVSLDELDAYIIDSIELKGIDNRDEKTRALFLKAYKRWSIFSCGILVSDEKDSKLEVPKHVRERGMFTLQFGTGLATPIPDLSIGAEGISGTMSFLRKNFKTFIPWKDIRFIYESHAPNGPDGGSPATLRGVTGGQEGDGIPQGNLRLAA